MAVIDTTSGTIEAKLELRSQSTFGFAAISPDGRSLYLNQYGEGATKTRIFDVPSSTLLPTTPNAGAGATQNGVRTPAVLSPGGRWMYSFYAGSPSTNCTSTDGPSCVSNATPPSLVGVDMLSRRIATLALPTDQPSSDFEKYLLWSVGVAPSGDSVYAVNPALGVVDEIDARQLTLRRTGKITVSRGDDGAFAAITRFFFPIADAKRYITGGAVLSPDGTRIYAVAYNGVSVVGTESLTSSAVWKADNREFDTLALTPDGERLYAVSNASGVISIISTREGSRLTVTPDEVLLRASKEAGIVHGLQTLRQLLPVQVFRRASVRDVSWTIPCVDIEDRPRFAWRGSHLDVGRHFMPKEFILKHLDLLALHKLNVFHWHLTEDQGWRIEIKKYPRLTEVGAWRKDSMTAPRTKDRTLRKLAGKPHGGFYTRDDVREVVR